MHDSKNGYRSLFWPLLLVGVGIIWLLSNLGFIPATNMWTLWRLWPVALIVIGLDILFGRRSPLIGALIGFLAVAGIILLLVAGPAMGLVKSPDINTITYQEALGEAKTADLMLDLSMEPVEVSVMDDSENLLEGEFTLFGEMDIRESGSSRRSVSISSNHYEQWFPIQTSSQPIKWDVYLNDKVNWNISVDASSGKSNIDLRGIELDHLSIDASSGRMSLLLPESEDEYEVEIEASSGRMEVDIPEKTNLTVILDGSSGLLTFDLPSSEAAVRVKIEDDGSGVVNLPGNESMSGTGSWESKNFDDADYQIVFIIEDVSSGNIIIE